MPVRRLLPVVLVLAVSAIVVCPVARAWGRLRPQPVAQEGMVNLPYQVQDAQGTVWMLYGSGWLQQQGNTPMFSQAAVLQINQNQPTMTVNQARLDATSGEVVFENMPCQNTTVTRRVKLDKDAGVVRYVDLIRNTQNAEQTVQLALQTNTNFGVTSAQVVPDPKRKDSPLAWVAQTSGNRTVVELYNGRGAKQAFSIAHQQGNNQVVANMSLVLPAGKEVAVVHFHTTRPDPASGAKWVQDFKESRALKDLPAAIRRQVVNFPAGQAFVGEHEVLRGDQLDVVELRTGDQYRGTLKETSYKLATFYGPVELPVDKVIGLINVGEYRPRQLVVTADGEIFGGKLDRDAIAIELSSGQVTRVPLAQVGRLGYRKRPGEPEEWTFDKPMVLMRSGDRMRVQMPASDVEVATRYGPLKLKPAAIAAIAFVNDEHGIHQVFLADGSKFAGLVTAEKFDLNLSTGSGPGGAPVSIPSSAIDRLQFTGRADEPGDDAPTLALNNDDQLVGVLAGKLNLETAFDTLNLDAAQVKSLRHAKGSVQDVQVTMWDETVVSGQLAEPELTCQLRSGITMRVPVALVEEYTQPSPQPSDALIRRVNEQVAQLNADDWRARDRAEAQLTGMGPIVVGTLKQLRDAQAPEAQHRIDSVIKRLEKPAASRPTPGPDGDANPTPQGAVPQGNAQPAVEAPQVFNGPVDR